MRKLLSVLLMLALTKTRDWKQIQEYFKKY